MHERERCRHSHGGATLRKFREGNPMSPVHLNGARLPQRGLSVHRASDRARGKCNRLKIYFPITARFSVRFHTFFCVFGQMPNRLIIT